MIERVVAGAGFTWDAVGGIGIGCTGPVDTVLGLVQNPYTLPTWDNLPLVAILTDAFHKPVVLVNDAHAAALGEHGYGAGRGTVNMVYMTVSTGVGGGLILNGRLYRGNRLMAGEIGHQTIDQDGRPCYCGARGCLEMYAAGPAIASEAQGRVTPESRLWALADGKPETITGRMVGEAGQQGDALAITLLREAGSYIGVGIANLINIFAPEIFVLGGGVMQSHAFILPAIQERIAAQSYMVAADNIRIVLAELGLTAGVVGAACAIARSLAGTL
jgi:glucokinase